MQTWAMAEATVSRASSERGSGATVHSVEYTFTTSDGQTFHGTGTMENEGRRGDITEIRYDPKRPSRNHAGFSDIKVWYFLGFPLILMLVGIGALALLDTISIVDLS